MDRQGKGSSKKRDDGMVLAKTRQVHIIQVD